LLYTETNDGLYWDPAYHDTSFAAAYAIFNYAGGKKIPKKINLKKKKKFNLKKKKNLTSKKKN
jgi:hypothetical protein